MEKFAMKAGTARQDITPPLHIPYLAYHPRHDFPQGVHDPLFARALVLQQGEASAVVLAVDSIGFSRRILGPERDFTTELRQRIAERTGIDASHIVICATHAHSTPETINFKPLAQLPGAMEWLKHLMGQLADCAVAAYAALRPAHLKLGEVRCEDVAWNRHSKEGVPRPIDSRLNVALIEYDDGPPDAILRFTCHPIVVQVQPLWSADFPGVACAVVEEVIGGNCLFLQGAAGDINPICNSAGFAEVETIGQSLGEAALEVIEKLRGDTRTISVDSLQVASSVLSVPSRFLPDLASCEATEIAALRALENSIGEGQQQELQSYLEAFSTVDRIRMGGDPYAAEIQILSLGDWALIFIPGELFVEFGYEIEAASSFGHTWIIGCCNDYLGYLTKDWAWTEAIYPARVGPWSLVSQEGSQMIVNEAIQLLNSVELVQMKTIK